MIAYIALVDNDKTADMSKGQHLYQVGQYIVKLYLPDVKENISCFRGLWYGNKAIRDGSSTQKLRTCHT